ncbi:uncharacterized protein [Rutidosis leptorrhynchoides]|uniref:uncharacterized protein n=1 Tax=Rutidosis leptorrhynchoides TaxID=125765 RepID=UPI003A995C7E
MDEKAKLVSHSTINGFENNPFILHDDHKMIKKGKDQANTVDDHQHKQKDCESKNKKDMIKDAKLGKANEDPAHRQNQPKFVTFRVPPKNKRIHQQPGFNLDYSPPKTHPPSHN